VYFSLGFALVPAFVSMGMNIRIVALIFLPLALTMLIPLFLIKERSTKEDAPADESEDEYGPIEKQKRVGFITAMIHSFKNKSFIFWMCTHSVMNVGLQLFLSGINEYFSTAGLNMTFIMASAFVPVPLTLIVYNKVVKKKGLGFAFQYILAIFSLGMALMFFCGMMPKNLMLPYAIFCAIIVSFGIGAFFSVSYTVPSQLAMEENKRSGICASSMFFAVEGLFEGVSAGFASGVVLIFLKQNGFVPYMTVIVAAFCMTAFVISYFLPKSIRNIGKEEPKNNQ
jgi:Na+/melibiose symporter-like transporter